MPEYLYLYLYPRPGALQIPRIYKWRSRGYTRAKDSRRSSFALFTLIQSQRFVGSLNAPFHSFHCARIVFVIFRGFLDYYDYGHGRRGAPGAILSCPPVRLSASSAWFMQENFVFRSLFPVFQFFSYSAFRFVLFCSVVFLSFSFCCVLPRCILMFCTIAIAGLQFLFPISCRAKLMPFLFGQLSFHEAGRTCCKWVKF